MKRALTGVVVMLGLLASGCATPELVVLLAGEDGSVGELEVANNGESVVLDEALTSANVGGLGGLSKNDTDEQSVQQAFAAVLAAKPEAPVSFTLYFRQGTTDLVASSQAELDRMFKEVERRQAPDVQVTGHTDRVGTVEDNDFLAFKRADKVANLLVELGLTPTMVTVVGRGERQPLVPTEDEVAERQNRRVEVTVR